MARTLTRNSSVSSTSSASASGNVIRSHIPRCRQVRVGRKRPFVYEIELALRRTTWSVERRYSEFFALHQKLKGQVTPYPLFPPKRLVHNKDPKFVDHRRRELEKYIEELLSVQGILTSREVLDFLNVPPELLQRPSRAATVSSTDSFGSRKRSRKRRGTDGSRPSTGELLWVDMSPPQTKTAASNAPDLHRPGSELQPPDIVAGGINESLDQIKPNLSREAFPVLFFGSAGNSDDLLKRCPSQYSLASDVYVADPTAEHPIKLQAISAYQGSDDKDLTFAKGDVVTVVGVDEATGWWLGTLDGTNFGLVPMNCVQQARLRSRSLLSLDQQPPSSPLATEQSFTHSPLVAVRSASLTHTPSHASATAPPASISPALQVPP